MSIPFTQYLRPDGRRRQSLIDRPGPIEAAAHRLIAAGYVLEAEVLTTGEVSFTVQKKGDDDCPPLAHEICPNGPGVEAAVDKLITQAECRLSGSVNPHE